MKKKETFIYKAFGFPIKLINVPMRKVIGEWVIDVDFEALQIAILKGLIEKNTSLTGPQLRFIRKFFEMSTVEFGKIFGVSHVSIVKWENEKTKLSPLADIYIRLYIVNRLHVKDKEFRKIYNELRPENLQTKKRAPQLHINIEEDLESA